MSPTQATFDAIVRDLRKYFFEDASVDQPVRNREIARTIIDRYGTDVVIEGFVFAVLAEYLQSQPNWFSLTYALNAMPNLYNYALDFVSARNASEATAMLASIVYSSTDEDVRALAAVTLASPYYVNAKISPLMEQRFNQTEGTSCRMAIALLLYQCGDDKQLKAFIRDGYLPNYEPVAKKMGLSKLEKQSTMANMLVPQILRILFEDIATNGQGYNGPLGPSSKLWQRKHYE